MKGGDILLGTLLGGSLIAADHPAATPTPGTALGLTCARPAWSWTRTASPGTPGRPAAVQIGSRTGPVSSLRGLRNAPRAPVPRSGTQRVLEARNRALRRVMSRTRDPHWSLSRHALAHASSVDLTTSDSVTGSSRGGRQTLTGHPASPCGPPPADLQARVTGGRSPPNLGVTPVHESPLRLNIRPPSGVTGQWLREVGAPSSVLSARPSSLEIRRTSPRTSGISHRHVPQSWLPPLLPESVTPPGRPVTGRPASPSPLAFRGQCRVTLTVQTSLQLLVMTLAPA